jgi:hypothetical protein
MFGRSNPALLVAVGLLTACLLAACGDAKPRPPTKAEHAAAVPFAGRDAAQVGSAFPGDARDVLEQAETITLYTLNPFRLRDGVLSPEKERFHNYGVLGSAEIKGEDGHRRMAEAVYSGLLGEGAGPANCFIPRHGLRFEKGAQTVDLLICFECTWVYIFGAGAKNERRMLFGPGVKPVFDSAVRAHHLAEDGAK